MVRFVWASRRGERQETTSRRRSISSIINSRPFLFILCMNRHTSCIEQSLKISLFAEGKGFIKNSVGVVFEVGVLLSLELHGPQLFETRRVAVEPSDIYRGDRDGEV